MKFHFRCKQLSGVQSDYWLDCDVSVYTTGSHHNYHMSSSKKFRYQKWYFKASRRERGSPNEVYVAKALFLSGFICPSLESLLQLGV